MGAMSNDQNVLPGVSARFLTVHRGEVVAVAIVGIVLGIVALVWPEATLVTVAIVFGIYLLVSGIFRITVAFLAHDTGAGMRWLTGILGLLVAGAGVYCLVSPERSLPGRPHFSSAARRVSSPTPPMSSALRWNSRMSKSALSFSRY